MEKEMTLVEKQDRLAVSELSLEDIEFVSGGDKTCTTTTTCTSQSGTPTCTTVTVCKED